MISGDLGYDGKERLQEIGLEIRDVETMLKAMIKPLENKYLSKIPLTFTGDLESWPPCTRSPE